MRRFLVGFLVAVLAAMNVDAQTPDRIMRIGIMQPGDMTAERERYQQAFRNELRSRGWTEGRNLVLEYYSTFGKAEQLPELAVSVVNTRPDAIVATGGAASARAAYLATKTIPIVMVAAGGDPVSAGLIQSLAHPATNVTGSVILSPELNAKRLELIKELVPQARRVSAMWNSTLRGTEAQLQQLQSVAPSLGLELTMHEIRLPEDFPQLGQSVALANADALLVLPDPAVLESHLRQTLDLVERLKLPAVYPWSSYVAAGGLVAYGPSLLDLHRRAAVSLDRILRGANPAELPVEQPTIFELVTNLRTAKALGLMIPPSLLARADEVIE